MRRPAGTSIALSAIAVAGIALAGCGGSGSGETEGGTTVAAVSQAGETTPAAPTGGAPSAVATETTPTVPVVASADDIVLLLNSGGFECLDPKPDSGAPGVEEVVCTHDGTAMVVDYAESKAAMDEGIELGRQYGLTDQRVVRGGDRWAVIAASSSDVPAIRKALGL